MSTERRLAELERRVSALANTIRSSPGASTVGGAEFLRAPQMGFPAKLTSVYNATTGYDWEQRTLTSSGGVQDGGDPLTGTRAWEIAGRTDLTSGSYVWLEPAPTGQGYLFSVSASSSGSGTVTSIVTKEVDGAPSYTFTSTISMEFDQADGFVLSQPAAGRVKIDIAAATATQAGIVSTAAQTFAGDKDFDDDVNIDGSLVVQTDTFLNGILDVTLNSIFRDYVVMQGVLTVADNGTAAGVKAGAPLFRTYDGYGNTGGYNGAFEVTADLVSYTNTTDRVIAMWGGTGATVQPGQCEINGVIKFRGIADADAPNDSLYYSTTASKLVYKDSGGTVNNLY